MYFDSASATGRAPHGVGPLSGTGRVALAPAEGGLRSRMGLTLVDATDKRMGTVFSALANSDRDASAVCASGSGLTDLLMAFELDEAVFTLTVSATRVCEGGGPTYRFVGSVPGPYFTTSDCSGRRTWTIRRIMHPPRIYGLPPAAVGGPGATLYLADPEGVPETLVVRSIWTQTKGCHNPFPNTVPALPACAIGDLATVFTPPFRLPSVGDRLKPP